MEDRPAVPAWLRSLLVFAALGFVTVGLAVEAIRISDAATCADRSLSEPITCPAPPGPYEIPLTLAIEVVVAVIAVSEVIGTARGGSAGDGSGRSALTRGDSGHGAAAGRSSR